MEIENEISQLLSIIRNAVRNDDTETALRVLEELNAASEESSEPTVYELSFFC